MPASIWTQNPAPVGFTATAILRPRAQRGAIPWLAKSTGAAPPLKSRPAQVAFVSTEPRSPSGNSFTLHGSHVSWAGNRRRAASFACAITEPPHFLSAIGYWLLATPPFLSRSLVPL